LIAGRHRKTMHGGDPETTNNRMELTAAIEALNVLKEPSKVVLHTDSKYVMDGINEWMANWKKRGWKTAAKKPVKNQELWMALDEATQRHEIQWKWVKGHDMAIRVMKRRMSWRTGELTSYETNSFRHRNHGPLHGTGPPYHRDRLHRDGEPAPDGQRVSPFPES
jgi:hypothetical protein